MIFIMGIFQRNQKDDGKDYSVQNKPNAPANNIPLSKLKSDQPMAPNTRPPVSTSRPLNYGIEDAIKLMRKLPSVNTEIVVSVVKTTLESTNVQVPDIIADAERKEQSIHKRTAQLEKEIAELEQKIAKRNEEIATLQTDLQETTKVKEHLLLAEQVADDNDDNKNEVKNTTSSKENNNQPAPVTSKASNE